jgi:hypothetical protein
MRLFIVSSDGPKFEKNWMAGLLQNYRLRKELGLLDDGRIEESLCDLIDDRILNDMRSMFGTFCAPTSPTRRSYRRTFSIKSSEPSSPRPRSRSHLAPGRDDEQLRSIIDALEERIEYLEARNATLSRAYEESVSELEALRHSSTEIQSERDQLVKKLADLQAVVSSETRPEKVLERVNDPNQLEFKLEIYKQQILMLNEELDKLKHQK